MKYHPVKDEVMAGLEELFTKEALTADKVASAIDYFKENYKEVLGCRTDIMLRVYAGAINRYFGHSLIRPPWGTILRSGNKIVTETSFFLDIDNLLLLNQKGKPRMLDKLLRKLDTNYEDRTKEKLKEFFREFYTEMKQFDWQSRNANYNTPYGLEVKLFEKTETNQVTIRDF